jgi:predicted RNA-binding protein
MSMESEQKFEKEKVKPISLRIEDEIGVFSVQENEEGDVILEVTNEAGEKVILNDILPKGWEVVGNKRVWKDSNFLGLANTETSLVMHEPDAIVVSESELKRDGWRYVLTFLHESGHIMRHEADPELKKKRDLAFTYSAQHSDDSDAFKEAEKLIAEDERDAWAFAIREFKKLVKKLDLPKERIFDNANELMAWIFEYSLGCKAEWARKHIVGKFTLSEEEKARLATEIFQMYTRKDSLQNKSEREEIRSSLGYS